MGSSPRPTILSAHDCISVTSYRSVISLGGMLVSNGGPLSMGSAPHRACTIYEPSQRAWGLVVRPRWHHLLGWSGGHICLCSGSRLAFTSGCQQGPPWVGPATSAMAVAVVMWNGLHKPGQSHFHPIGWHHGRKDSHFYEQDQWLHYPLEFHYAFCQTAKLTRDW